MFTSAAILLSYFWGRTLGGGGTPVLIHAYVRWGVPLDLKMHGAY